MRIHKIASIAAVLDLAACLVVAPRRSTAEEEPEGVEVLARGPVHEAYAAPSDAQPQASPLVPKAPPDPIEEQPPDQKPEGDNVVWLSGYWAWDAEAADFLWVSGFWRDAPAGRHWMPGSWQQTGEEGWRWIGGFWAPEEQDEAPYVPTPPETLERGPTTPEPEVASAYVPGIWIWRETRHVWRPGFWLGHRPGWVWAPASYVWTTAGCVFVEGYWDHPLHDRGLLFAPVRVERRLLVKGWSYQPRYVIQTDALLGSLFVRPAVRQYVFGDYFAARYEKAGFIPWLDYRPARNVRDFNFSYYRSENHGERRWEESLRGLYAARRSGDVAPPPRTLVQQTTVVQKLNVQKTQNVSVNKTINLTNIQNLTVLAPLTKIDNTKVSLLAGLAHPSGTAVKETEFKKVVKLQTINAEQKKQVKEHVVKLHESSVQRKQIEEKARIKPGEKPRAVTLTLPKAPAPQPRPKETSPRKPLPPLPMQIPHFEKPKGGDKPVKDKDKPKKDGDKPPREKPKTEDKPKLPPPPPPKKEEKPKTEDKPKLPPPPPPKKEEKPKTEDKPKPPPPPPPPPKKEDRPKPDDKPKPPPPKQDNKDKR